MRHYKNIYPLVFFLGIALAFFYKFFLGYLPFPGDLLISEYTPWKTYSYLGYNPGSYPNKAQYFDVLRQLYPWKSLVLTELKNGFVPLWNPYNFSGTPLLANFQSAPFYPLGFIYFFMDQKIAWVLLIFFQPFLAGYFTYLYSRTITISKWGSIFAGISYGFSFFMIVWIEYNTIGQVILWLPLALLSVEKILASQKRYWLGIFIASLSFPLFAGHIQVYFYLFIFVGVYVLFRLLERRRLQKNKLQEFVFFGFLMMLVLGIGAIQVIPGIELIKESARVSHEYNFFINKILIQPWQLIMFFVPDFFGNPATRNYWLSDTYIGKVTSVGLVPIFFLPFTFFLLKSNKFVRFFAITSVVLLTLTTKNPISSILYSFDLPFISSSAPTLSIFLFCFSISILAGFGLDRWKLSTYKTPAVSVISIPIVFVLLWIGVFYVQRFGENSWGSYFSVSLKNLMYSTAIFIITFTVLFWRRVKGKYTLLVIILLLCIHSFDLFRSFQKFNPFSPAATVFPSTDIFDFLKKHAGINRFWGYGNAYVEANFATQYGVFAPDGYDPLYIKRYGELIQSSKNGKIAVNFSSETRSDAVLQPGYGELEFGKNPYRKKILNMLGVKYILDREDNASSQRTFLPREYKEIYHNNGWKVLENLTVSPRIFLTSDYQTFRNAQEFEELFFNENFDSGKKILLEEKIPHTFYKSIRNSQVAIIRYVPTSIELKTNSDQDGLLFISDAYYPGWEAEVDSLNTKIYRANYAFRAIFVPQGSHTIRFTYNPSSFKLGLAITTISLGVFFIVFIVYLKKDTIKKVYRE